MIREGQLITLEEAEKAGWYMESEGQMCGTSRWKWETWISPDETYMATFWTGTYTATVERYE